MSAEHVGILSTAHETYEGLKSERWRLERETPHHRRLSCRQGRYRMTVCRKLDLALHSPSAMGDGYLVSGTAGQTRVLSSLTLCACLD